MDESLGCLGGVISLALLFGIVGIGGLLLSSHAVLYRESKEPTSAYFVCSYFTGLRTVEMLSGDSTGCKRFIPVGASQ